MISNSRRQVSRSFGRSIISSGTIFNPDGG
jgi:hypothetical protein